MGTPGDRDRPDGPAADEDRYVGWRDLTIWTTPVGRLLSDVARRGARVVGPYPTLAITLAAGVAVTVGLTAASVEIYDAVVDADGVAELDRPVLDAAIELRTQTRNRAVTGFTNLGGPVVMPVLAAAATLGVVVWRRRLAPVVLMVVASAGSLLMTVVGKALVGRIRPSTAEAVAPFEDAASFPSGHTLNAVVVAGVLAYLLVVRQRRWWVRAATIGAAAVFSVAMGLSRVYLGHHWLTDVLVAWTLGLSWLAAIIVVHRLYLTIRHVRRRSARG